MDNFTPIHHLDSLPNEKKDMEQLITSTKNLTITNTNDKQDIEKKYPETIKLQQHRCNLRGCNKRLTITETLVICKCGNTYCTKHRHTTHHRCTYDYKQNNNKEELINARFEKLNRI